MTKRKRNALLFGTVFVAGTAAVAADHVVHRGLADAKPAAARALSARTAPCAAATPCAAGAVAAPCAAGAIAARPGSASTGAPPPRIAGGQNDGPRIATPSAAPVPGPRIAEQP